ncbi:hypothetical protein BT96DRAFT_650615 [Gymnopus androsaceus JB14]|uniref:BRCT domain-containing protein n=1 Tax=Gymnopus androsaceus JB14 TaxID=1447944 RepID=A0A6A4HTU2_9AGAR|nr:hypothetical protein BT96DRAFT_650615 [Gymnopus androsaceus JB14]
MRRRGNKSAKVPNVKLRPAQPGASLSSSSFVIQDSQIDNDDTKYYDPTPRPFAGVVLCATGITDKPTIFKQAVELGATTINDFTDRVTHLIALQHGGAKYMCALDRKIPILKPSWITDSHHIWLHGDDVDLEQSITQHRLPIFTDVVLCVSGIPDIVRRTQINKLVTKSGGSYVKALERPVRVTHLLCSGDDPTDKMYYAEKFNKQGEASIKLVWEEWFWDCLEFGGRFEEDRYQMQHPRPKPRKSVQEVNPNETSTIPGNDLPPDDDEPVQASISKPVGFQRELWRSVLAPRGYDWNDDGTSLVKSPTKRPATRQVQEDEEENLFQGRRSGSVLSSSSFRRANSFAQLPLKQKQPLRRLLSTRVIADDALGMEIDTPGAGPSTAREVVAEEVVAPQPPPAPSIFSGLRFAALGEADSNTVREAIQKAGGTFIETEDGNVPQVDIIIVRLVSGSKMFRSLTSSTETTSKFRTECWLEKCLYEERPCPPESHVTFTPVGVPCPISGAENVRISFSGLDNAEKFFMTRLVKVLGLNLLPSFSKRATHLLCPSAEGLKFEKAQEWGVPVVGMAWMEEMKRTGKCSRCAEVSCRSDGC